MSAPEPLRVLVVATQVRLPDTHGGSTHVGELVTNLGRLGPVKVLAKRGSTRPDAVGVSFDVGFSPVLKHLLPLVYFPQALRAARRFRPDVIYERASSYGLGGMLAASLSVPMLCMVLDEHYSLRSLRRAGRIVATNLGVVPAPVRHKGVKVSWGANAERFHPEVDGGPARRRLGLDGLVLCYVGSFKRWHGLERLVDAAAALREQPFHYLMIGDGPLRADIERAAADAGLGDRFAFTGAVPYEDVPGLVAAADICIAPFEPSLHPASEGGFILDPLKVFEYLAMAKPTITVASDNLRGLFEDGGHLLLVPPGDTQALIAAIRRLADDPEAARAMAERGRQRVLERHTWAAHAEHLYALFHEMRAEAGR